MTFRSMVAASLALALAGVACTSGTETGNPPAAAELSITALSREAPTQGLALENAWVFVRRLTLVPCDASAGGLSTYDFPIDLFHEPPAQVTFESAVTEYCAVRLAIAPFGGSTPAELDGLSAFVSGTRSDEAPFELRSTLETTLVLASASGPLDATRLVLGVELDHWFLDADVHGATTTDGTALIDAESNPSVLEHFDAATSLAFALYVDANDDGELTDDELTPVASAVAE